MDIKDIKKSVLIFGGITLSLAGAAIYAFIKDGKSLLDDSRVADELKSLFSAIEEHFQVNNDREKLGQTLDDKQFHVLMLQSIFEKFVDEKQLKIDLKSIKTQSKVRINTQQIIQSLDMVTLYLTSSQIEATTEKLYQITKDAPHIQQQNIEPSSQMKIAVKFLQNTFVAMIVEMESILRDVKNKAKLIEINYYFSVVLGWLEQLDKEVMRLLAVALLLPVNQFDPIDLYTKSDDYIFATPINNSVLTPNSQLIFDLLLRYTSLITPTLQKSFISILLQHQIFSTKEQLVNACSLVLKNIFYLNCQLQVESMYYLVDASLMQLLILQGVGYKDIRLDLCQNHPQAIETMFLFVERVLSQNKPKFWPRILPSVITQHCALYPLFQDKEALQHLVKDQNKLMSTIIHFFGVLMIFETQETYEINKFDKDNSKMMSWLAQNMDTMLAAEVISTLQLPFLRELIKSQTSKDAQKEIFKTYLQFIRVVQIKRIQQRVDKDKQETQFVDINVSLTKSLGYVILGLVNKLPDKKALKLIVQNFPFQDRNERANIFSNVINILFDLPTMNFYFLQFISPRCEEISNDALLSFKGYYAHVLSAQTLSFDLYMVTLQISFLFSKPESFLKKIQVRVTKDMEDFETYKSFLLRDLIVLVDILENEYYFHNVMNQYQLQNSQAEFGQKFNNYLISRYQSLQAKAVVAIMQLNQELRLKSIHETLKLFVHTRDDQFKLLDQILEPSQQQQHFRLKQKLKSNYPFMSLQKDMESVNVYIKDIEDLVAQGHKIDLFDELLNNSNELPYLQDLRVKIFLNPNFQTLLYDCYLSNPLVRVTFYPWIVKLIYYAMKTLNYCEANPNAKQILKHKEQIINLSLICSSIQIYEFVVQIEDKPQCSSIVSMFRNWLSSR